MHTLVKTFRSTIWFMGPQNCATENQMKLLWERITSQGYDNDCIWNWCGLELLTTFNQWHSVDCRFCWKIQHCMKPLLCWSRWWGFGCCIGFAGFFILLVVEARANRFASSYSGGVSLLYTLLGMKLGGSPEWSFYVTHAVIVCWKEWFLIDYWF